MGKHLVDIDERMLARARSELGAKSTGETVNAALRLAAQPRADNVRAALDTLASVPLVDRQHAWG